MSMPIEQHRVTDRALWLERRKQAVNASEIGALFGCHPYKTQFGLYAEKTGIASGGMPDNAVLRRGRLLESAAAEAVRELRPNWVIEKALDYLYCPERRMGATPDFFVRCPQRGLGVLQTKVVSRDIFERDWTPELPPAWINLQVQQEMLLAGVTWGAIGALIVDPWKWPCWVYEQDAHRILHSAMEARVSQFWESIASGEAPAMDYGRDGDVLKIVAPQDNGEILDLRSDNRIPEVLARREALKALIAGTKPHLEELEALETEIKAKLGQALGARLPGWEVKCPTVIRKAYIVKETTYRKLSVKRLEQI